MITSLSDALAPRAVAADAQDSFKCAIGTVDNLDDTTGQRRVRVRLSGEKDLSVWARMVTLGAGNGCGVYFPPPLGTQALVYLDGPHAYLLGTLWNGEDKPPPVDNSSVRVIVTPAGHTIRLTDTAGEETLEILAAGAGSSIVLDASGNLTVTAGKKIVLAAEEIELDAGRISMTTQEGGTTIQSQGPLAVKTPGTLTLEGKQRVDIN